MKETQVQSLGQEDPLATPVFLPRKSHGRRSLAGYSSWGHKRPGRNLGTKQQQMKFMPTTKGAKAGILMY